MKTELTKVIFRKFKTGEIIALFPELPGDNDIRNCLSYQHVGQHGSASILIINDTKPAKLEEYIHLYQELFDISYNLKIVTRFSYQMDQKRIKAIRERG